MQLLIKISVIIFFLLSMNNALALPRELNLSISPSEIQYQLIDPFSNITGYNPLTNNVLNNIPNLSYIFNSEPMGASYPTKYQKFHVISPNVISNTSTISTGKYNIKIFGSNTQDNFLLSLSIPYPHMGEMSIDKKSLIYPNVTWIYEFDVPATPTNNGLIVLTKVSTPTDFIKDLTTAGQLGYIGNAKFVTELTKEINEIEAEKAKGKVDDGLTPAQKAKKEYTELLKEITEKYNKPETDEFVKQEAYDVLKEDLEYIINHIQ